MLMQIETVCAKNTELANILRSPWVIYYSWGKAYDSTPPYVLQSLSKPTWSDPAVISAFCQSVSNWSLVILILSIYWAKCRYQHSNRSTVSCSASKCHKFISSTFSVDIFTTSYRNFQLIKSNTPIPNLFVILKNYINSPWSEIGKPIAKYVNVN